MMLQISACVAFFHATMQEFIDFNPKSWIQIFAVTNVAVFNMIEECKNKCWLLHITPTYTRSIVLFYLRPPRSDEEDRPLLTISSSRHPGQCMYNFFALVEGQLAIVSSVLCVLTRHRGIFLQGKREQDVRRKWLQDCAIASSLGVDGEAMLVGPSSGKKTVRTAAVLDAFMSSPAPSTAWT